MKLEILKDQNSHPEQFVNISEVLAPPGILSNQEPSNDDYKYILCLIGTILENNQITVGIYKENNIKDRIIDLSAIQFIFSVFIFENKAKSYSYFIKIVQKKNFLRLIIQNKFFYLIFPKR